jgi:hypothetical protein
MRTGILAIFSGFLLLAVVFVLLTTSVAVAGLAGHVTAQSGRVEVQRSGQREFAALAGLGREPARVKVGDRVRTGADGRLELQWADGTRLALAPKTSLVVRKYRFDSKVKAQTSLFRLDVGKIWTRVSHELLGDSRFEVETPDAVAAVRGTIFSVETGADGTQVAVYDGKVHLATQGGQAKDVTAGRQLAAVRSGLAEGALSDEAEAAFGRHEILLPSLRFKPTLGQSATGKARVRGQAEPGATVTIAGQPVTVAADGSFDAELARPGGRDSVEVVVTDAAGHRRVVQHKLP